MIIPGLGQIYFNRLPSGFYLLFCFIVTFYLSHVGDALLATMTGHFDFAQTVLKPECLLFMPSIYLFAAFDAYVLIEELNNFLKSSSHASYQGMDGGFVIGQQQYKGWVKK
ncbi:hypothetical protein NDK43_25255 [Neobacillus pocheonensis]|uniref:Uncharacterized protein n=1 Tax=Neobacillus pocheonensis TaxID=363869 RepID=A0ABT0WIZ1_9BACI|nr:hypothetical protein [Neobacillus pocheonensis]